MLLILAAGLIFTGPTYVIYALQKVTLPYLFSVVGGLVVFVVGLALFMWSIRKQTKIDASE